MRIIDKVLVVEDCEDDLLFIIRALRAAGVSRESIAVAGDGAEAIRLLKGSERRAGGPVVLPDLIFTDLTMPGTNGFDLLRWLKSHPMLMHTPTVVLSGWTGDLQVQRAFAEGASCYFCKPVDLADLQRRVICIVEFWKYNQLSRGSRPDFESSFLKHRFN